MSDPYNSGIPPVPPQNPYAAPGSAPVETNVPVETKILAMLCHFIMILGPIIIWSTGNRNSAYLDYHGKEALNFQITVAIAYLISLILMIIAIGAVLLPIVGLGAVVFSIIGGVSALEGNYYRYPFAFRFIK
ncbi:MAG: DUF4870 domain-containing protein [Verrucomicrobiota bacterium]